MINQEIRVDFITLSQAMMVQANRYVGPRCSSGYHGIKIEGLCKDESSYFLGSTIREDP